jgi:hypothetical protein
MVKTAHRAVASLVLASARLTSHPTVPRWGRRLLMPTTQFFPKLSSTVHDVHSLLFNFLATIFIHIRNKKLIGRRVKWGTWIGIGKVKFISCLSCASLFVTNFFYILTKGSACGVYVNCLFRDMKEMGCMDDITSITIDDRRLKGNTNSGIAYNKGHNWDNRRRTDFDLDGCVIYRGLCG